MTKLSKWMLGAVMSLACVLNLGIGDAYAADSLEVSAQEVTGKEGDEVTVDVNLDGNPGMVSLTLSVAWDAEELTLKSVANAGTLPNYVGSPDVTTNPYIMIWEDATATENLTTTGKLASLTFEINEGFVGTAEVTVSVVQCFDFDFMDLESSVTNGAVVAACNHNQGAFEVVKEATCTVAGSEEAKCSKCGEVVATQEIVAKGHTQGAFEVVTEATCTVVGSEEAKCTVCGEVVATQEIAAKGHTQGTFEVVKEATCDVAGSEEAKCTVCGEVVATKEIAALGHSYGEWVVVKEATETEAGLQERTCSVCGDVDQETIAQAAPAADTMNVMLYAVWTAIAALGVISTYRFRKTSR